MTKLHPGKPEHGPDKSPEKIESMFDEISGSYDRLNHLFTMKLDLKWRKAIISEIIKMNIPIGKIMDIASGTGDITLELLKLNSNEIIASDISSKMLEIQGKKITDKRVKLIKASVENLPFENNYFDVITIGFGVRNFQKLESSLSEINRVLKPGGLLIILEMFRKKGFAINLFNLYFGKIMPWVGNKVSKSHYAYSYLFESVKSFLTVSEFIALAESKGYRFVKRKNNFLGIVNTIYLEKAG
jgi:demethylmenaquinone methyltransferase/2-methoxy-6-polyprenyl-1,4-benzoquinol methylase